MGPAQVQPVEARPFTSIQFTGFTPVRWGSFLMVLVGFWLSALGCAQAQDSSPTEYQIKAAFLFNFAKFVEWPEKAFTNDSAPMVIGVLGNNVFGDNLQQVLHNKSINNRPVELKILDSTDAADQCQVLFISASEEGHFDKIMTKLKGANVLTVSESDRFIAAGGMINFVIESNRIRFEINNEAAQKAGLKISSKLLSLAVHSR